MSLNTHASSLSGLELPEGDEALDAGAAAGGERDWEAEARSVGWKPLPADPADPQPHEYKGDPAKWTDARSFIQVRENNLGVMRENMNRLTDQNQRLKRDLDDLRRQRAEDAKKIDDLLSLAKDARASGYKQARRDLEQRRVEAIQNGDVAAVDQISEGLKEIDDEAARLEQIGKAPAAPTPTAPTTPQLEPHIQAFLDANPWFRTDPVLHQNMVAEHMAVIKKHPAMPDAQRLDIALGNLKKRFPTEFGVAPQPAPQPASAHDPVEDMDDDDLTPPRRHAPAVAAPRATPEGGTRHRSPFERIPAGPERDEAKREFKRFQNHDPGLTEAEYVETYLNPSANIVEIQAKYRSKK